METTISIPFPDITIVNLYDSTGVYEQWLVDAKLDGEFWDDIDGDIENALWSFKGSPLEDEWNTNDLIAVLSMKGYKFYKVFDTIRVMA